MLVPDQRSNGKKPMSSDCRDWWEGSIGHGYFIIAINFNPSKILQALLRGLKMLGWNEEKLGQVLRSQVILLSPWDCSYSTAFHI